MTIDILAALGAVAREVETREVEGKPARVVRASRVYPTDIDDLWDAVTNPERLPRWFLPVSGDLRLGGHYQLKGNAGGEIQVCEPPRRLGVTWAMGGGPATWVDVRLTADGEGTLLVLEHAGHVTDMSEEFWKQYGPGAVGVGWDGALLGLALHVTPGAEPFSPEAAVAWQVSDEGKAFNRASAEGWRRAAVAWGDDPTVAAEAAARTVAFYTGEG